MPLPRWPSVACLPLACAALLLAGCGDDPDRRVQRETVAKAVAREVESQDVKASSVTCPEDLRASSGARTSCTVRVGGVQYAAAVTLKDVDGDDLRYGVEVGTTPSVPTDVLKARVAKALEGRASSEPTITCPSPLRGEKGKSADCVVTASDGSRIVATATTSTASRTDVSMRILVDDALVVPASRLVAAVQDARPDLEGVRCPNALRGKVGASVRCTAGDESVEVVGTSIRGTTLRYDVRTPAAPEGGSDGAGVDDVPGS